MNSHAQFIKLGLDASPLVATRLLNGYIRSQSPNSLRHAQQLFDQVVQKDTVLWSSMISAYTRSGYYHNALQLFSHMRRQTHPTCAANHFIYASVARACGSSSTNYFQLGRSVHACVIKSGFIPNNVVVETAFLDMYAKCNAINCARRVFDEIPERNLVTWNAMIAGYVHNEIEINGLGLFYRMKCQELFVPDEFTIATVLAGCAWSKYLWLGMQVHCYLIVSGFELNCVNSVCNMYFQCGEVCSAEKILNGIELNAISKLMKIRGYVFNQRFHDVIRYIAFENNLAEIFQVDYTVIVPILTACTKLSLLRVGRQLHGLIIASFNSYGNCSLEDENAVIGSALIAMYCKCGSADDAWKVFDNWQPIQHVSHWNAMIAGYIYNGLVDDARELLEEMPERNVVTWTSLISGYLQNGMPREGLNLLAKMYGNEDGVKVRGNCLTFVMGLEACSHLTDMEGGKQVHAKLVRTLENADISNVVVGTALVDMYAKSGNLRYARTVFDWMLEQNVVTWTSIITGYAVNGLGSSALELFQKMTDMGIEPNEVTFVSVLTACSYCGLVDEGLQYFKLMREKYRMVPREDHYTCLIDMLGRVGRLEDAWSLVVELEGTEMTNGRSSGSIWAAMLGACHLHGNVEMGRRVAERMLERKQQVSTTYVTLSNVYAAAGMWNQSYRARECWKKKDCVGGEPGLSQICTRPEVA